MKNNVQTRYNTNGEITTVVKFNEDNLTDKLPPKVYTLMFDPDRGYFLKAERDRFLLPTTIYGDTSDRSDKIITAYDSREGSTGILLFGDKGSGKTMLAEATANTLLDRGVATVLVTSCHTGDAFINFLNDLGDATIIFDEFGKVYSEDSQESLLPLLDGASSRKRLILLTENRRSLINDFMLNRPGRVYYVFEYGKLEQDVVEAYCVSKGLTKKALEQLMYCYKTMPTFSFDILKAIVEEHKLYPNEDVEDLLEDLNIMYNKEVLYQVKVLEIKNYLTNEKLEPVDTLLTFSTAKRNYVPVVDPEDLDTPDEYQVSQNSLVFTDNNKYTYKTTGLLITLEELGEVPSVKYS